MIPPSSKPPISPFRVLAAGRSLTSYGKWIAEQGKNGKETTDIGRKYKVSEDIDITQYLKLQGPKKEEEFPLHI